MDQAKTKPDDSCSFKGLLDQLLERHNSELHERNIERNQLVKENEELRRQLKGCGITPFDLSGNDSSTDDAPETSTDDYPDPHPLLSAQENEIFKLRNEWNVQLGIGCEMYMFSKSEDLSCVRKIPEDDTLRIKRVRRKWTVISPNCAPRIVWEVVGLVFICYDLVAIPFTQAFSPPSSDFSVSTDWLTLCFWTGDMLQGFFLGYFEDGIYVEDQLLVLRHYFKTWFLVDCIVVLPDWITKLIDGDGAGTWGEMGKVLKGARAIRVMRLLRLAKLQRILNMAFDRIQSEYTFIILNLLKMLVIVLVMNHLIACAWYGLARAFEHEINWISVAQMTDEALEYQYLTSLHWSLTQFTPAGMDISARNSAERVFSIVVLFFAMIAFSSIVANITSSMTKLRNMSDSRTKELWLLRRYLKQRKVPTELTERISKFLDHRLKVQALQVSLSQVSVIKDLSDSLRNELFYRTHSPLLMEHHFFKTIALEMEIVMHKICSVLRGRSIAEQEYVFAAGDIATQTFFTGVTNLRYKPMNGGKIIMAAAKECIAEAALWVDWRHQGDLEAVCDLELFELDPKDFFKTMQTHPIPWYYAVTYARKFLNFISEIPSERYTDIIRDEDFQEKTMSLIFKARSSRLGGNFPF